MRKNSGKKETHKPHSHYPSRQESCTNNPLRHLCVSYRWNGYGIIFVAHSWRINGSFGAVSLLEDIFNKLLLTALSECDLNLSFLCTLKFTWRLAQLGTALQMCHKINQSENWKKFIQIDCFIPNHHASIRSWKRRLEVLDFQALDLTESNGENSNNTPEHQVSYEFLVLWYHVIVYNAFYKTCYYYYITISDKMNFASWRHSYVPNLTASIIEENMADFSILQTVA